MTLALLVLAVSAAAAASITPIVRYLALRACLVDHAIASRKIHRRPVPRLGGVAIVVAFAVTVLGALAVDTGLRGAATADAERTAGLLLGGLVIAALGLWDDVRGVRARHKLAIQASVALLAWWLGFRIDEVANPFGAPLQLGVFGLPFTVLWITGIVNALNLIDGLDGLAAGVAAIAVSTNLVVAGMNDQVLLVLLTAALAGAALGFLVHNFNPASIFMGDTGSMFLGFVLATTSIQAHQKSTASVALLVPVVALALPIGDTLLAMCRRAMRGAPLFGADREHVHHRLLALGLSHRQAVLALYGAALILALAALALAASPGWAAALTVLMALAAGLGLGIARLGYAKTVGAPGVRDTRRRNLTVRARIRRIGQALRSARTPEDVWEQVEDAATLLGAGCVSLSFRARGSDDRRESVAFARGLDAAGPDCLRARFILRSERPADGALELGWMDGRTTVDRDTEIAVELLCEHVTDAIGWARLVDAPGDAVAGPLRAAASVAREA